MAIFVTKNSGKWRETRDALQGNILALRPDLQTELERLIVPREGPLSGELSASDMSWNIVSMSSGIHRYLGMARFALKWLGPTGDTVVVEIKRNERNITVECSCYKVQWHWLPPAIRDAAKDHIIADTAEDIVPRHRVRLDSESDIESVATGIRESFLQRHKLSAKSTTAGDEAGQKTTARDEAGRLIESGRVFTLKVDKQDLAKTEAVVKAQWLLACMASFSGAAEAWDQLVTKRPPYRGKRPLVYLARTSRRLLQAPEADHEDESEARAEYGPRGDKTTLKARALGKEATPHEVI